ncbi:AUX/IAA protein [Macleaya cordata]|uniref:Auxin-responsive protein n=1 Tax=Macleaya cordata TaxID=56857 RepID=A0A200QPV0_MACCD|nr:AUX/IAA protein [Macleaya cordata]
MENEGYFLMESGGSRTGGEICAQLLDLIPRSTEWKKGDGRNFGVAEERELELKLGPPGGEDWFINESKNREIVESPLSLGSYSSMASKNPNNHSTKRGFQDTVETENNNGNQNQNQNQKLSSSEKPHGPIFSSPWCSTSSSQQQQTKPSFVGFPSNPQNLPLMTKDSSQICNKRVLELQNPEKVSSPASSTGPSNAAVNNTSQKRTAPAPVVGWPPVRSFRKNLANSSSSKPAPESQNGAPPKDNTVKPESCKKGLFVKINMDGVPIGRKVDLKAYDSYEKLSSAVDELFRGLLAAQRDSSADLNCPHVEEVNVITGLLDGTGEYTLVYEDNEGDRMLVGDVPWDMFASTVKRLRVLKSSELSALHLGNSKQGKTPVECGVK